MKENHKKCLLLNVDYSVIGLISWKRAIVWHFRYSQDNSYSISILDFYKNDAIVGTHNKKFPVPAVAKTNKYFHSTAKNRLSFSRKNIFLRDDYTCQYCGKVFEYNKLTYDHVVPRSLNGPTNWTNIVTACFSCNNKKGNRTPKQANMPLLQQPIKPDKKLKYSNIYDYMKKMNKIPEEWEIYVSWC